MDNGSVKKRDLSAPCTNKLNPWWPLITLSLLLTTLCLSFLYSVKRFILSLFKQKKSVKGKVVLITGAGRGLGRGVAMKLSKLGAHIACLDINTNNNEDTVHLIRKDGGTAEAFTCNIAKSEQVERVVNEIRAKMGPIDILINNAALLMGMQIKEMEYKDIRGMFEVNAIGPSFMVRAVLPDMLEKNSGHIVAISSIASWSCGPFMSLYSSTKSAVSRFHENVRVDLDSNKNNNIKVTIIHPYFVNTSADLTHWINSKIPFMTENYVCQSIVDNILYERENVAIPRVLKYIQLLDVIFPSYMYNIGTNVAFNSLNMPNKKHREELPYSTIIDDVVSKSS